MISKMIPAASAAIASLLIASSAQAVYVTGFGDKPGDFPFVVSSGGVNQELEGQDGWYDSLDPNKVSYLASVDGNNVGAIGGTYFNATNVTTYVGHDYSGGLLNTAFNVDFNITQSSIAFPGADNFGWTFVDDTGSNVVLSLVFSVDPVDSTKYNVGWSSGAGVTSTTASFFASTDVHLSLTFAGSGADATFDAQFQALDLGGLPIGPSVGFSDTLIGAAGTQLGSFNATWTKTGGPGDNFMSFDNVSIPEPTGLALAGVALGGMLVRRRRA